VAIDLWYHVGSKDEEPGKSGLAHFFEHMLFQGSLHVATNGHFGHIQAVGGVANGSTWYDRTNYYETLPSRHLELGLWLESDRMGFLLPALDDQKIERQRQVVLNERRQRIDNQPYGRATERLFEMLYPNAHPYGHPVIGYERDIAAFERGDVEAFFQRHYAPSNAVLVLAGDLEPEPAIAAVERWFGAIPAGEARPARESGTPAGRLEIGRETVREDVQLERVYIAWTLPPYGDPDWYAASMLAVALAGGKSSPLEEDLVHRRELAQDVSIHVYPTELTATMVAIATARPGTELDALEDAIVAAISDAAAGRGAALEDEAWHRARRRTLVGQVGGLESVTRKADQLAQHVTYFGDPASLRREIEIYQGIEPAAAAATARRHLGAELRVTLRVERLSRGSTS
jgi:zinc protease